MRQSWLNDVDNGFQFQFTRSWFRRRNLNSFQMHVLPIWEGRPVTYLEIGVFEAQSLVWMMQNVLTHPDSRAVGIDPHLMTTKLDSDFMEEVRQRAEHNIKPYQDRCALIRGCSAEVLRRMLGRGGYAGVRRGSVDICMIDGDHNRLAVVDDAQLCLQLVRVNGWLLFDDVENDKPKADHVKQGIQTWLTENPAVELVWKHRYMECYRRVA